MRIQHNITAMNSYRNYTNNANKLSKNLEKLSSGYKINRAGDDAAGLAISEKMRSQITGLSAAQKNVKDGISLVKTAEGALQEVHDMLNRMTYLATQSANGTYDNEVDRSNLQKELSALSTEIDRIADSSNFNGRKLLDGALGELPQATAVNGKASVTGTQGVAAYKVSFKNAAFVAGDKVTITVGNATKTFEVVDGTADKVDDAAAGKVSTESMNDINKFDTFLRNESHMVPKGQASSMTDSGKGYVTIKLTESTASGNKPLAFSIKTETSGGAGITTAVDSANTVKSVKAESSTAAVTTLDFTDKEAGDVLGTTMRVDGDLYQIVSNAGDVKEGHKAIVVKDGDDVATKVKEALVAGGIRADYTAAVEGQKVTITSTAKGTDAIAVDAEIHGGGLKLQIGDTAEDFNHLRVSVGDMHAKALGIADVDISTQEGAAKAVDMIKAAINTVSSTRGDLGALQNRLEHTNNNLAVMEENIQDAESTIRDTDVADEMTEYTKNNILLQSAQAMLAQANQLPQGVLQLLG